MLECFCFSLALRVDENGINLGPCRNPHNAYRYLPSFKSIASRDSFHVESMFWRRAGPSDKLADNVCRDPHIFFMVKRLSAWFDVDVEFSSASERLAGSVAITAL